MREAKWPLIMWESRGEYYSNISFPANVTEFWENVTFSIDEIVYGIRVRHEVSKYGRIFLSLQILHF